MSHRRETPARDGNGVTDFGSQPVDQVSEDKSANGVCALEGGVHFPELLVAPMELTIKDRLQQGENLPVHVVDSRREEQQSANDPTIAAAGGGGNSGFGFQFL